MSIDNERIKKLVSYKCLKCRINDDWEFSHQIRCRTEQANSNTSRSSAVQDNFNLVQETGDIEILTYRRIFQNSLGSLNYQCGNFVSLKKIEILNIIKKTLEYFGNMMQNDNSI